MPVLLSYPSIAPAEKRPLWFNFDPDMASGVTIVSCTFESTSSDVSPVGSLDVGTLNDAQNVFTVDAAGTVVQQIVSVASNAKNASPVVTFKATMSNDNVIPRSAVLPIGKRT